MAAPDIQLYLQIESHLSSGMSVFQMDKFVIDDQITPYRRLRQAVMETRARLENITSMGYDIEELRIKRAIEMENLDAKKKEINHSHNEIRLIEVKIARFTFEIDRKQSIINQQEKEVAFFNGTIAKLAEEHFGGTEALVKDLNDPAFHLAHEKDFWTEKFARGLYSDLLNYGTVSKGLAEAIANLEPAQQKQIVDKATEQHHEVQNLLTNSRNLLLTRKD